MSTSAIVSQLPKCSYCEFAAHYDGKTKQGPWAYMCEHHWKLNSVEKLGTGYGQRLVLAEQDEPRRIEFGYPRDTDDDE